MFDTFDLNYLDSNHPISNSGSRVPFGLKSGKMFEPRQVLLGKDCGCICPGCDRPLVAKHCLKGKVIPHFAHQPGENCQHGRESAIHLAAKQLIEERHELYIPKLSVQVYVVDDMGNEHSPSKTLISAGLRSFSKVRLEQNISNFRPDLVATTNDGKELLVEIAVTHFSDELKRAKIKNHMLPCIEINASKVAVHSFDELAKLLFEESSNRVWLHHPDIESTELSLHQQLVPKLESATIRAKKQEAELRNASEKRKIELEKEQLRQIEAEKEKRREAANFKALSFDQKLKFLLEQLKIEKHMVPAFLDYQVRGAKSFGVPCRVWQLAVFVAFIEKRLNYSTYEFNSRTVLEWLTEHFKITPEFNNSDKIAIWDFLKNLNEIGILKSMPQQRFLILQDNLKQIISNYVESVDLSTLNLDNYKLEWENIWPSKDQINLTKQKYQSKYGLIANWNLLAELMPEAKNKQPSYIAQYYCKGKGGDQDIVLRFLIEAGYVHLCNRIKN